MEIRRVSSRWPERKTLVKQRRLARGTASSRSRAAPAANEQQFALWKVMAMALLGGIITYLPSLSGPFIFDDFGLPFAASDAANQTAAFWIGGVRPVLMASYWLSFWSSGRNAFGYHLANVCLHALAASLAYVCAVGVLKRAGISDSRLKVFGVLTAGLFLLHPLQTESVAYIAGRSEVLAGVFFLGGFAIFLRESTTRISYGRVLGIILMFGAAILTKEHTVVLPALLILTGVFWSRNSAREHLREFARLYCALLVLS